MLLILADNNEHNMAQGDLMVKPHDYQTHDFSHDDRNKRKDHSMTRMQISPPRVYHDLQSVIAERLESPVDRHLMTHEYRMSTL